MHRGRSLAPRTLRGTPAASGQHNSVSVSREVSRAPPQPPPGSIERGRMASCCRRSAARSAALGPLALLLAALIGPGVPGPAHAASAAQEEGSEVRITSLTTGPSSSVAVDAGSSGANALGLLGSSPGAVGGAAAKAENVAITVDGSVSPIIVSLDAAVGSPADVVAVLNADASFAAAATASVDGTNIKIASSSTGLSSSVVIDVGVNALRLLGTGVLTLGLPATTEDLTVAINGWAPQRITISSNIESASDLQTALTISCSPDEWIGGRWKPARCTDGLINATVAVVDPGWWADSYVRITSDIPGANSAVTLISGASGSNALQLFTNPVAVTGTPGLAGATAEVSFDGTNIVLRSDMLTSTSSSVMVDSSSGPNVLQLFGSARSVAASGPNAAALFGGQSGVSFRGEASTRVRLSPASAVVRDNVMMVRAGQIVSGIGLTSTAAGPVTVEAALVQLSNATAVAIVPTVHWLDSALDACGTCLRNSSTARDLGCLDCRGIPVSSFAIAAQYDQCGFCGRIDEPQFNYSCSDCLGLPNGDSTLDECGICRPLGRQSGPSNSEAVVGIACDGHGGSTLELVSRSTDSQSSPILQHLWALTAGAATPSILQPATYVQPTLRVGDSRTELFALAKRNNGSFAAGPTPLQAGQAELPANSAILSVSGEMVIGNANERAPARLSLISNNSEFKVRVGSRLATAAEAMGRIPFFEKPANNLSETGAKLSLKCGLQVDCAMTVEGGSNMSGSLTWSGANGTEYPTTGNNDRGGQFRLFSNGMMKTLQLTGMSSNSDLNPIVCRDQQCYDEHGTERTGLFFTVESVENAYNYSVKPQSVCTEFVSAANATVSGLVIAGTTITLDGAFGHPEIATGQAVNAPTGGLDPGGLVMVSAILGGVCVGTDNGTGSGGTLTGSAFSSYDFSATATAELLLIIVDEEPSPQSYRLNLLSGWSENSNETCERQAGALDAASNLDCHQDSRNGCVDCRCWPSLVYCCIVKVIKFLIHTVKACGRACKQQHKRHCCLLICISRLRLVTTSATVLFLFCWKTCRQSWVVARFVTIFQKWRLGSISVKNCHWRLTALHVITLGLLIFQSTVVVQAGEAEAEAGSIACESPHQVASVAQAVTGACQGDAGNDGGLPEHCTADCAAVFLPWFDDAQGTCFTALHLDEQRRQSFAAFASACSLENSEIDMTGAIFIQANDSQDSTLICFDVTCVAPILDQWGAVVVEGCEAGAPIGSICRLGCRSGFEISAAQDGHCTLAAVGSLAVFNGQSVTCSPETQANGQMSEAFCRMASTEAMLDCCELEGVEGVVCAADVPPTTCVVECAEIWEPLVEDCEQHLQDFQRLTAECAEVADSFLARAPSSLTVAGLQCVSDATGVYQIANTIGGKPHWVLMDSYGNALFHLYAVDEPFEAWVIGMSVHDHSVRIISFENEPPWGPHVWRENCGTTIGVMDVLLTITPSFSDHDCHEAIVLMNAELTAYCFDPEDLSVDFQASLDAEGSPTSCEYDCAHVW